LVTVWQKYDEECNSLVFLEHGVEAGSVYKKGPEVNRSRQPWYDKEKLVTVWQKYDEECNSLVFLEHGVEAGSCL